MSQWISITDLYKDHEKQQRALAACSWEEKIEKIKRMRAAFANGSWGEKAGRDMRSTRNLKAES